ncbi:hypothetical protein QTP86_020876, partial [Hemibagrus guttatus]
ARSSVLVPANTSAASDRRPQPEKGNLQDYNLSGGLYGTVRMCACLRTQTGFLFCLLQH